MQKLNLILIIFFLDFLLIFINAADVVVYPRTTGYPYPCPIPKTGQTISYATNDDGWNSTNIGIAWPTTRFTIQSNTNCVRDNLTGLIWARNANLFSQQTWSNSLASCNNLDYGDQTDWRMPNMNEMISLIDLANNQPPLPTGHPFNNVLAGGGDYYWVSTTYSLSLAGWGVNPYSGNRNVVAKTEQQYVWPVRGP